MKEEGQVINWFEIKTPDGYLSINNTIGDIMITFGGKIVMMKFLIMLKDSASGGKKKDDNEEKKGNMLSGFKVRLQCLKTFMVWLKDSQLSVYSQCLVAHLQKNKSLN